MTKVYLAARFGRQDELRGYRNLLRANGYDVTSNWIDEAKDDDGTSELDLARAADADLAAIRDSDELLAFTESEEAKEKSSLLARSASRGGRHVELGYALGVVRRVSIIGPPENIFCHLPEVEQYDTLWDWLAGRKARSGSRPPAAVSPPATLSARRGGPMAAYYAEDGRW